jgi:hypothetical protein
VRLEHGRLESALGWCLVDLRGVDPLLTDFVHVRDPWDLSGQTAFPIYMIAGGANHGSWWVNGPQEHLERTVREPFQRRLASVGASVRTDDVA